MWIRAGMIAISLGEIVQPHNGLGHPLNHWFQDHKQYELVQNSAQV